MSQREPDPTPTPGRRRDEKIAAATAEALVADGEGDWYALSFADESGFLGGAYVRAPSMASSVARAHLLGINPGGEVHIIGPLPADALAENVPEANRERLLTREEWA